MIVKKTYKDQVIDHIYQLLLADQLKPGDRVKERVSWRWRWVSVVRRFVRH
jgi:Ser-tRNA(Ala) deacylase AlaX